MYNYRMAPGCGVKGSHSYAIAISYLHVLACSKFCSIATIVRDSARRVSVFRVRVKLV